MGCSSGLMPEVDITSLGVKDWLYSLCQMQQQQQPDTTAHMHHHSPQSESQEIITKSCHTYGTDKGTKLGVSYTESMLRL